MLLLECHSGKGRIHIQINETYLIPQKECIKMNELISSFHNESSNIYKWFKIKISMLLEVHRQSGLHGSIKVQNGLLTSLFRPWTSSIPKFCSTSLRLKFSRLNPPHRRIAGLNKNFWKIRKHFDEIRFDQNFCSTRPNAYPIYTDNTWQRTKHIIFSLTAIKIDSCEHQANKGRSPAFLPIKCIKSQKLKFAQMFYL